MKKRKVAGIKHTLKAGPIQLYFATAAGAALVASEAARVLASVPEGAEGFGDVLQRAEDMVVLAALHLKRARQELSQDGKVSE